MPRERLAERRRELGLSQGDVADAIRVEVGNYSRYERGLVSPRPAVHKRLAKVLDWTPAQLTIAMGDEPQPVNGHEVPGWLGHHVSLEQAAGRICAFEATTVHGLLQTSAYATAVETVGPDQVSEAEIARRVKWRLARQAVLDRDPPLDVTVVLDESVLARVAGSPAVMADQLDHLGDVSSRPNVDLRVLPFAAGMFVFGSFTLFSHPEASTPFMAVTEDRAGAHYLDRDTEREAHVDLFACVHDLALDPDASVDLIAARAKEYRQ